MIIDVDIFKKIDSYFEDFDKQLIKERGALYWDTNKGIYGTANCKNVFEFFKKINLQDADSFLDLGSGDGRVVMVASLFTTALGVESDPELIEMSNRVKNELNINCNFGNSDFTEMDLSKYNVIFINPDQSFSKEFETKLKNELSGKLYIHNEIFQPSILNKGQKFWQNQIPIVEYTN